MGSFEYYKEEVKKETNFIVRPTQILEDTLSLYIYKKRIPPTMQDLTQEHKKNPSSQAPTSASSTCAFFCFQFLDVIGTSTPIFGTIFSFLLVSMALLWVGFFFFFFSVLFLFSLLLEPL